MKLIDGDELANRLRSAIKYGRDHDMSVAELEAVLSDVESMRAIEQEPMRGQCLPSAQPERKTGKWLDECMDYGECSECGFCGLTTDYCPSCGADMRDAEP